MLTIGFLGALNNRLLKGKGAPRPCFAIGGTFEPEIGATLTLFSLLKHAIFEVN
jgi:hypothetical protein